jgi:superfamily I DNA/RNA helicase
MCFPTEQQAKVINHTGKPLVVIAAPGTGKTRTIVTRMIKLLKEDPNREVSFITFTRTSPKDTESKVRKDVGKEKIFGVRLGILRFGVLHKKVGPSKCGIRNADCGIDKNKDE